MIGAELIGIRVAKRNCKANAKKEQSNESGLYGDSTDGEDIETLDCMEVEI